MHKGRLEAFSDGVIAILITIMVLEMKVPHTSDWAAIQAMAPIFLSYVLSYIYIGIYWSNHHHILQAANRVTGGILWANLHLLFWLSLIPFTTAWMGENHFEKLTVATYSTVLLMAGFAYYILSQLLIRNHGHDSPLAKAIGNDFKGKISLVLYSIAIVVSFFNAWVAYGICSLVAVIWLVPDRRIEKFF